MTDELQAVQEGLFQRFSYLVRDIFSLYFYFTANSGYCRTNIIDICLMILPSTAPDFCLLGLQYRNVFGVSNYVLKNLFLRNFVCTCETTS